MEAQVEIENDLLDLANDIKTATTKDAVKAAKGRWANARKSLQRKRLRQYREQWFEDRKKWKITSRGEETPERSIKGGSFS